MYIYTQTPLHTQTQTPLHTQTPLIICLSRDGTEKHTMKGHRAEGNQLFSTLTIKALYNN